jgi:hypothetical protein
MFGIDQKIDFQQNNDGLIIKNQPNCQIGRFGGLIWCWNDFFFQKGKGIVPDLLILDKLSV